MTTLEIALLAAVAALVYQELWWRERVRRMEAGYEKRIATEVAMAYDAGLAEGPIRSFAFRAEKVEPHGLFREATRQLFIAVTMSGDAVKYAAGDLAEIDRFEIPPEMRRAILEFMAPRRERAMAALAG